MRSKTQIHHSIIELKQPIVAESKSTEREYEFFNTNGGAQQLGGEDRGRIRRVVMKNFLETQWSGGYVKSENHSRETVQKKTNLKSRFRLPKPGLEASPTEQAKSTRKKDATRKENFRRKGSHTSSETSPKESKHSTSSEATTPDEGDDSQRKMRTNIALRINPGAHLFDPFDVIPVPGTWQLNVLIKLYKFGGRINSVAINARNSWWSFISNDAGLLHATLATWALYGILIQGMCDLQVEKIRHKTEAIREVNKKIGCPGGQMSDELIGTVATLASCENLLGAYDDAQLHIAALKRMVGARGGISAFGHNDGLMRGILWIDIHTATAFRTPPSFPKVCLDPDTPPLPEELLEEAAYTSPTSLLSLSLAGIECFNIFYRLHRLALAVSPRWTSSVSRLTFSNLLYETEYMQLSVPDYSRDFLDFDLGSKDEQDDDVERATLADSASVVEALLAASQIFVYAALREIPPKARLFGILLERLRVALDRPNTNIVRVWEKANNLQMLLWVLVVASSVAPAGDGRKWWVLRLAGVVKELGVPDRRAVQEMLEKVAWTDTLFAGMLGDLWQGLSECGKAIERGQSFLMPSGGIWGVAARCP